MDQADNGRLVRLTARLVSAYVSDQKLPQDDLEEMIAAVYVKLLQLYAMDGQERRPAVPIPESIKPDYLVCLENGLRFRTLKRHLAVAHGLTPEEYRARWNLPANYPMVAPNYSRFRSRVARISGLGGRNSAD